MHDYAGTANFPAAISLIDDSDSPNAGNFNPGHEGNRDALVYLKTSTDFRGKYRFIDTSDASFALGTIDYTSTTYSTSTVTEVASISSGSLFGDDFLDVTVVTSVGVTGNANPGSAHAVAGHFAIATKANGADWVIDSAAEFICQYDATVNAVTVDFGPATFRARVTVTTTTSPVKIGIAGRVNATFAANTTSANLIANGKVYVNWYRAN